MKCGTILHDTEFVYSDGTKGKKLLVLLSNGENGDYLTVKTTSKSHHKGIISGCQNEDRYPNFYLPRGCCCLIEHTWVLLDAYFPLSTTYFITGGFAGRINQIGVLPDAIIIDLLHCAINSEDLKQIEQDLLIEMVETLQGNR